MGLIIACKEHLITCFSVKRRTMIGKRRERENEQNPRIVSYERHSPKFYPQNSLGLPFTVQFVLDGNIKPQNQKKRISTKKEKGKKKLV